MPYVERRDEKVVGVYANMQAGYAEEFLEDDHPDVVAFRNPPPPVPQQVSLARARIILRQQGLFDTIDAGLKALPEPQRSVALEAWERENFVSRNGMLVTSLAGQFGLTEAQLDALFTAAAAIEL